MTALIAEDEAPQRRALARLLAAAWPELRIVAECADGASALAALEAQRPTVAFLDIRMAGKTGLDVALQAEKTHVVFTTAYEQHAVRAFELGAVDYILKPVTAERLKAALLRVQARLNPSAPAAESGPTLEASPAKLTWITAVVGNGVKLIPVEEVLFFQACERHTRIVSRGGEAIIRMPLRVLLGRLDTHSFWQIHRSYIVRLGSIDAVRRNELGKLEIGLRGSDEILPVSQQYQHRFRGM